MYFFVPCLLRDSENEDMEALLKLPMVSSVHETKELRDLSRGGGTPYMKGVGMLVVSLRGVNFRFWSRLGVFWAKHHYI